MVASQLLLDRASTPPRLRRGVRALGHSCFAKPSLLHDLLDLVRQWSGDIEVALAIHREAVRPQSETGHRVDHFAVLHDRNRFGVDVADVQRVVRSDQNGTARFGTETCPLFEKFSGSVEYLNAAVLRVGDNDPAFGIHDNGVRYVELSGLCSFDTADLSDELSVL